MYLKIKKLDKNCIGIKYPAIEGDAGYDIYSNEECIIKAKSSTAIKTGVCIELPKEYWFEIMSKSGLATKHSIAAHNGVVDNGYRGEIIVYLYNHSDVDYKVHKNDKVAQGVIRKLFVFNIQEEDTLSSSDRGSKGFGSTGR